MHGWPNHIIEIKSRKETIEIEIALIDKKKMMAHHGSSHTGLILGWQFMHPIVEGMMHGGKF